MANKTNKELGIYKITHDIVPYLVALSENGGVLDLCNTPVRIRLKLARVSKETGALEYQPRIIRKKEFKVLDIDYLKPKIQVIQESGPLLPQRN